MRSNHGLIKRNRIVIKKRTFISETRLSISENKLQNLIKDRREKEGPLSLDKKTMMLVRSADHIISISDQDERVEAWADFLDVLGIDDEDMIIDCSKALLI